MYLEGKDMNNNDMKTSVGAREKLPFWFGAAWSGRSVSVAVCMALMGYTAYYCTDVVGMNPTLVGILLMVSKLFDGFTDLVVGFVMTEQIQNWEKQDLMNLPLFCCGYFLSCYLQLHLILVR